MNRRKLAGRALKGDDRLPFDFFSTRSPTYEKDILNGPGNLFGLPLNEATPAERLRGAKSGMDAIKDSPEARVFLNLLGLFGQLPHAVEDIASFLFARKASLVMTNVTGPPEARTIAGAPVDDIVFWVPHPVSLDVGVSIVSYAGNVSVGVIADSAVDLDPETITTGIARELEALKSITDPPPGNGAGPPSRRHAAPP